MDPSAAASSLKADARRVSMAIFDAPGTRLRMRPRAGRLGAGPQHRDRVHGCEPGGNRDGGEAPPRAWSVKRSGADTASPARWRSLPAGFPAGRVFEVEGPGTVQS